MSIHSSLKISGGLRGSRNVWTRMERLVALQKEGRWQEGESVLGLPKVRTRFKVKSKKQLKPTVFAIDSGGGDPQLAAQGAAVRGEFCRAGIPAYPASRRAARALLRLYRYHAFRRAAGA